MATTKRTRYQVVLDLNTTQEIALLENRKGVMVYDTLKGEVCYSDGTSFLPIRDGVTGWGAYKDTQYTSGASFALTGGGAYVNIPNNGLNSLEIQKPSDIPTFYDGTVVTGREGDGLNLTISFGVRPLTAQPTRITTVPDIGGAVGEIEDYEHDVVFGKGQNIVQRYLKSYDAYTLDTWEANGATMKIKASHDAEIFGVRYLLTRTHKAR